MSFGYELLDNNDVWKKDLDTITRCVVRYSSLSQLKIGAEIRMREDNTVNYQTDRIRPICKISKGNQSMEFPLGIFLISSPNRDIKNTMITREMQLYSKLYLYLGDRIDNRYYVTKGTNVIAEVKRLLGTPKINIIDSAYVTSTNREWEIGTSKLSIINDLLDSANYTSLRVNPDGYYVADPYVLPSDREIDIEYVDDIKSVLSPNMTERLDLFNVPNKFIAYTNNPDAPTLRSVYTNTNPESITSTVYTGRVVAAEPIEVLDVVNQEVLDEMVLRSAYNASQVYSHVDFETAIMPIHDYMDVVYLKHKGILLGKYTETNWEIECKAGTYMKHTARKVVMI
ncbi:MAG TPA: hypothetical protein GX707_11750 [Epulopiscium sp.]|nr:hypothetical protein [Candidatus Epulonipiscium sp.]